MLIVVGLFALMYLAVVWRDLVLQRNEARSFIGDSFDLRKRVRLYSQLEGLNGSITRFIQQQTQVEKWTGPVTEEQKPPWIVNEARGAADAARSYGYSDLADRLEFEPRTETWEEVEQSGHELVQQIIDVMNESFFETVRKLDTLSAVGAK